MSFINLYDSVIDTPIASISHPLNPIHDDLKNTTTRKHINILFYNIFLRPPGVKNNESDHKDARLKEFIKLLPDYDIICLQEMFGFLNKRKHKLIRCAAKAGFLFYTDAVSPSFFTSFVVDGGLLVLSRFPILSSEFKPYPYGIFSDALSQKGALYAKIQIKDEILHLYSTHTQASYIGSNQKFSVLTRADQFSMLREFIQTTLKKNAYKGGEMVLCGGDFNVDSRAALIQTEEVKDYPGFKEYPHLKQGERFSEYNAMTCYLSDNFNDDLEDLLFQTYGEHPITYAESNNGKPMETVLTDKDDLCSNQSLDYIFKLNLKNFDKTRDGDLEEGGISPKKRKLRIQEGSAKVAKFFVESLEFTQLSDHYGSMVTLEYKNSWAETPQINRNQYQTEQTVHDKMILL